jgi:hypothetical protein
MKSRVIFLSFSDPDLAQSLADSTPPDGVTIKSKPQNFIECSQPAEIWTQLIIGVGSNALFAAAVWIVNHIRQRGHKTTRINHYQVVPQSRNILALFKRIIAADDARDAQWKREHQKPRKRTRKAK